MDLPQSLLDNYYKALNIKSGAPLEEVKKAYRSQAKFWHPDRFPSVSDKMRKQVEEKLQEVNHAYQRLDEYLKSIAPVEENTESKVESISPEDAAEFPKEESPVHVAPRTPQENYWNLKPEEVTLSWNTGDQYCGETSAGKMHGFGTYYYAIGHRYVGDFKKGSPHGRGTFYYVNGDVFTGDFVKDSIEGFGTYDYANGDKYIGQFENGVPHGQGTYILPSGSRHIGKWENGNFID